MKKLVLSLALAILATVALPAAAQTTPPAAPAANFTDIWWNKAESGWGVNLVHQDKIIFATFFVYDASGEPRWLVASNVAQTDDAGRRFAGQLFRVLKGSPMTDPVFAPLGTGGNNPIPVGSIEIKVRDDGKADIAYDADGAQVTKTVERMDFRDRKPACKAVSLVEQRLANNFQGLWWNRAESGWGINFAHQGDIVFATLFAYDEASKPYWLVMSAGKQIDAAGRLFEGDLFETRGTPFFNPVFKPLDEGDVNPVGTMRLAFADGASATVEYTYRGKRVVKAVEPMVFGAKPFTCNFVD